jgi:hypothetical protein
MNALAPDCTAAKRAASLSSRVRKISLASGRISRIAAAASAPAVRQPEIQQHHVRSELSRRRHALGHGSGLTDDLHVALVIDERGQPLCDDEVILHDEDADRIRSRVTVVMAIAGRGDTLSQTHYSVQPSREVQYPARNEEAGPGSGPASRGFF